MSASPSTPASPTGSGRSSVTGVDETVSCRHRRFVTHLVDLDMGRVIATVEGRSAKVLLQAFAAEGEAWLARVEQVAIDPFTPYANAIRHLLPDAVLVVGKFHKLRLFARAVDPGPPAHRCRTWCRYAQSSF